MQCIKKYASLSIAALALLLISMPISARQPGKLSFMVKVKDLLIPYKVFSIFVLPEEIVAVEVTDEHKNHDYEFLFEQKYTSPGKNKWTCIAPGKEGLYKIEIIKLETQELATLHLFVMVPYEKLQGEFLKDFRIGSYPKVPLKMKSSYKHPEGFIEITDQNSDIFVSPHFQLKQFLCKQKSSYPKYAVLQEKLLLKLELILEKVNDQGYQATTFNILSGYRTPYYNKTIGNVRFSRHIYGGAADIFVDERPKDGMMDDLNQDGKIDYKDAAIIYEIIEGMYGKSWYELFIGGLGWYKKTPVHGPFVHIDVRGFRARWGD